MTVLNPSPAAAVRTASAKTPVRAWAVFAVSLGLLLSDYMSRQVLAAVFPLLKADWGLSDSRLGALGGAVALMVGVLTVPLSLLADRIGRVRSVVAMAVVWSLATLGCALAANYNQLLAARLLVGVGEAAYGSVALAVVFSAFPTSLRATITGAFMAGGVLGSFAGMALGGELAAHLGWRGAFAAMALIGLVFAAAYPLVVKEPARQDRAAAPAKWTTLLADRAVLLTYAGSGLQLFVVGALSAWIASYLHRSYGFDPTKAALAGASALLAGGAGMVLCGGFADRFGGGSWRRSAGFASAFAVASFLLLEVAFGLPRGAAALGCVAIGLFFAAGSSGPAGAIVAARTPAALHGSTLALLTLSNNMLGLAPGPYLTGVLADRFGLDLALRAVPFAALAAAICFTLSRSTSTGRDRSPAADPAA